MQHNVSKLENSHTSPVISRTQAHLELRKTLDNAALRHSSSSFGEYAWCRRRVKISIFLPHKELVFPPKPLCRDDCQVLQHSSEMIGSFVKMAKYWVWCDKPNSIPSSVKTAKKWTRPIIPEAEGPFHRPHIPLVFCPIILFIYSISKTGGNVFQLNQELVCEKCTDCEGALFRRNTKSGRACDFSPNGNTTERAHPFDDGHFAATPPYVRRNPLWLLRFFYSLLFLLTRPFFSWAMCHG